MKTEEEKKEAARLRSKAWRLANKEKHAAYQRKYRGDNKDNAAAYRESKKDGLFTVYLLPKENYVGQTECLSRRLQRHRYKNRNTTDAKVLGKYKTREEALAIGSSYHAKGYNGLNNGL